MCLNACGLSGQGIRQTRQSSKAARGKRTVAAHFTVAGMLPLNGSSTGKLSLSPTSYYYELQHSRRKARIFYAPTTFIPACGRGP